MIRHPDAETAAMMHTPTRDMPAHPRHRRWLLQEGRVTFSQLIWLAVLVLIGTQGLKFVTPWYDHLRLRAAMQDAVHEAPWSTDTTLASAVLAQARRLKVPLDPRHLHVERHAQGSIRLWAEYDVTLTFPLGFSHTQTFRPEVRSGRR